LHKIIYALLDTRDFSSLLGEVATQAAELVGASYGYIFLSEGDDLIMRAATKNFAHNIGSSQKKPGIGAVGQVWQTQRPLALKDYNAWEKRNPSYAHWNLRALACIPIMGRDGLIGVLEVARLKTDPREFTPQEAETLTQLASLASLVLDNANLYAQAQIEIAERKRAEQRSDELLLNILPAEIAQELKDTNKVEPRFFPAASILFADFKNFTQFAESHSPREVVSELDDYFSFFDSVVESYGLEKLKTIGDGYMCADGIPTPSETHAVDIVEAALEMMAFVQKLKESSQKHELAQLDIRIGIHTGPLIAGVVGRQKFAYDAWGDTVVTASRMESSGAVGKINISQATYELVRHRFHCEHRGKIAAKNKGEIDMYFVMGVK
jgi:class 3 adenylate cyclase